MISSTRHLKLLEIQRKQELRLQRNKLHIRAAVQLDGPCHPPRHPVILTCTEYTDTRCARIRLPVSGGSDAHRSPAVAPHHHVARPCQAYLTPCYTGPFSGMQTWYDSRLWHVYLTRTQCRIVSSPISQRRQVHVHVHVDGHIQSHHSQQAGDGSSLASHQHLQLPQHLVRFACQAFSS